MIQDKELMSAVSRILQRSEKQTDLTKIISSFVDIGIISQLNNSNNQILYGRRGTGKTHVFKVLQEEMKKEGYVSVYIDARTLGSTAQFSDSSIPMRKRCLSLYRDILGPICNTLLEAIISNPSKSAERALDSVDKLLNSINEPIEMLKTKQIEITKEHKVENNKSLSGELNESSATLEAGVVSTKASSELKKELVDVSVDDKVVFPQLHVFLSDSLRYGNIKLLVLIDEWSSLPQDIQPYLAEFIKRGILPVTDVVIKIAALEYRSYFSSRSNGSFMGFELGADISISQELDDNYVFDRNPDIVTNSYADIIYNHLCLEIDKDYLAKKFKIKNASDLQSKLFTDKDTFKELARAAEGVIRDLINIFTIAFFHSQRKNRENIDKKSVIEASQKWFEQDKVRFLDENMQTVLRRLIDTVIGERHARSFLLPRELEKHQMIQKLFDARVIHHIRRGYADKVNPGVRYNIYSIDYGTYVDLIGTSKQPQIEFDVVDEENEELIVPFDDKRSIRRIILTDDILKQQ